MPEDSLTPRRRLEGALLMPPIPTPRVLRFVEPLDAYLDRLTIYVEFRRSRLGRRSSAT